MISFTYDGSWNYYNGIWILLAVGGLENDKESWVPSILIECAASRMFSNRVHAWKRPQSNNK
jgi:hypothetical protein